MDSVSFKSINFVKVEQFYHSRGGKYIDFYSPYDSFQKAKEVVTEGIKTCQGGGIVDLENKEVVGFHFQDCEYVYNHLQELLDRMFSLVKHPDKCLLIGGKDIPESEYSRKQFEMIKKVMQERTNEMTSFEIHKHDISETNFHYNAENDIWDINTLWRDRTFKEHEICSRKDILECFESYQLAPSERITFNKDSLSDGNIFSRMFHFIKH